MIRQSIAWHRIKGTPASIKAALALYGITASLEEHSSAHWAQYQMAIGSASVDEALLAYKVAQEMQPARCSLRRIYNDVFDGRNWVWSKRSELSKHIWSDETGIRDPETGLVISLGQKASALAGPLFPRVLAGRTDCAGALARLIRFWVWSHSRWSDTFPLRHSFSSGHLAGADVRQYRRPVP